MTNVRHWRYVRLLSESIASGRCPLSLPKRKNRSSTGAASHVADSTPSCWE